MHLQIKSQQIHLHLQILTYLKGIKSGMDIMLNELTAVKLELNKHKQLSRDNDKPKVNVWKLIIKPGKKRLNKQKLC